MPTPTNKVNGDAVTKQEALEALNVIEENSYKAERFQVNIEDEVKTIRDYINNADDKSQQEGGWQPIETAPKDGRHCLISIERLSRSFLAVYNGEAWNTIDARANWTGRKVTHWMPLPTAPEREE